LIFDSYRYKTDRDIAGFSNICLETEGKYFQYDGLIVASLGTIKYDVSWVGIDAGREGLWREPIWSDVVRIVSNHSNERVYDPDSPIYATLEQTHPNEAWRCITNDKKFRPLFRDYPNSWTRLEVISLSNQRFNLTKTGREVLDGKVSRAELLINLFKRHSELTGQDSKIEFPFAILAQALLETPRPLSTDEIYWVVMKNYRPNLDLIANIIRHTPHNGWPSPQATSIRRLRNMLTLMRMANVIFSTRRRTGAFWSPLDSVTLRHISSVVK
jgi:hypothetical protein